MKLSISQALEGVLSETRVLRDVKQCFVKLVLILLSYIPRTSWDFFVHAIPTMLTKVRGLIPATNDTEPKTEKGYISLGMYVLKDICLKGCSFGHI